MIDDHVNVEKVEVEVEAVVVVVVAVAAVAVLYFENVEMMEQELRHH